MFHYIPQPTTETLEYSFDAYGRRRDKDDWSYTLTNEPAFFADRGFTGHEHLDQFGLINMNGRLYDPQVGRFLSPDNYVQAPGSTQGFNRYSYCLNNPLRYTDQSGEVLGYDDAAEFLIGGIINIIINYNEIDNFYEGISYFVIGGVGTWVTCQSFGAASAVGSGITGFGNSLLKTDFLTEEKGYSFKSIGKEQWKDIAIQTGISAGAGLLGNWAGDKISAGITSKFNIQSEFWNKAMNQTLVNGFTTSIEMYGQSTLIDGNKWYSKDALGDLGIGLGAGMLTGFTQTYLVEKWAIPELKKFESFIKNLELNKSSSWNNLINNSYNPLITPMTPFFPNQPTRYIPSNNLIK
jgi:RHS repeat-associated protein